MAWMRKVLLVAGVAPLLLVGGPALAGGGGHGGTCYQTAPELDDGWIAIVDSCFAPNAVEVRAGQVVRWQMEGAAPHTVTFTDSAVGSGSMTRGMSYAVQFNAPGTYEYSCLIHPGMDGRVAVAGDAVAGSAMSEVGETAAIPGLPDATNAASVSRADPVVVSLDAGTGFTLILFGLALGAGVALVSRVRRAAPRDESARS